VTIADRDAAAPASRLANEAAPAVAEAFEAHQQAFAAITRRARDRFLAADWTGAVDDAGERLDLYGHSIDGIEELIRRTLGQRVRDELVWAAMKAVYSANVVGRPDREIAETFFNSVTRRIFATAGVNAEIEFVETDFEMPSPSHRSVCRTHVGDDLAALLGAAVSDSGLVDDGSVTGGAMGPAAERLGRNVTGAVRGVEIVGRPFFRRKGAYLVGRIVTDREPVPFALALLNDVGGVVLDAVLHGEDDLSILFSFTRSHFHVDVGPPHELVAFLKELMPRKPVAELYIAIGYHKHGKTELHRDLLAYLGSSDERFDFPPGTPGLVMVVFGMPGYDVVFKVIRDEFPAMKTVTREGIRRNYRLVFRHDRAGRLVEAQEFEHLKFARDRFTPALLDELLHSAGRNVEVVRDDVVVHHAYVERRVDPLDVVVRRDAPAEARRAVADFGRSIKDMAATNIFPGDLLPKNFGLTRNGRVVCYDYDELGLLTEFSFRNLPEATAEDDASDEVWFGAGPRDVFPEEFSNFLGLPGDLRRRLEEGHPELYDLGFWTQMQDRIRGGEIVDIFPYDASRRLPRA
jgi:isocitrate dehydrogenase kinase/phosphatase